MPMNRKATFPFFRSVVARMEERYIFNFRVSPDELAQKLPVPWLRPQEIAGFSVLSFCILWLKKLTVSPIPSIFPFETLSGAYRMGVIDSSGAQPKASVYITERWADLSLVAKFAPAIILDTVPVIRADLENKDGATRATLKYFDEGLLFTAEVRPAAGGFRSELFPSVDDFAKFIKDGESSFAPSIYEGAYTKVDLRKEDVAYEPLDATVEYSELHNEWGIEMPFDSAVRARGTKYKWKYRGLWYE